MRSGRSNSFARTLFEPLGPRYDRAAEILSFGQNRRWRRRMVDEVLVDDPKLVLDVATGTAGVALQLADRSRADVIGIDISEEMLRQARARVGDAALSDRVRLVIGTGEKLPFEDGTFDALTFTYLLRYVADPAATVRELVRVVKPGGHVANLEFMVPSNPLWRAAWFLYTKLVLPLGGLLFGRGWFDVGRFLGPSITEHYRRFPLGHQIEWWREAGLTAVSYKQMSLGGGVVIWGTKT